MRWSDVDLEVGWWSIPGALTKNGKPHRLPLLGQALDVLKARRERADDEARFVFENRPGTGSIAHRGKKAAAILSRSLTISNGSRSPGSRVAARDDVAPDGAAARDIGPSILGPPL